MTRPLVFGVLNVTPDSFSDGGKFVDVSAAVRHAELMVADGADVIDVGGESTRPGAAQIDAATEIARVVPVITALKSAGIAVSLDTMRSETARAGIELGVDYINDVSGGKADSAMHAVVASADVEYILMHWRGHSTDMDSLAVYSDVVTEVHSELMAQREIAIASGISPQRIVLDPGFGFSKNEEHNWEILRHIDTFSGSRMLVGVSRKRFLASVSPEGVENRDAATAAISLYSALHNVWAVRVHDVASTVTALNVAERLAGNNG